MDMDAQKLCRVRPDIFRFLDYRDYLREFFSYLSTKDSKFSQRWVAQKAGMRSPQLISMILKGGRKLGIDNAQLLAMALGLDPKEEEYLLVLIELENASHQEKQLEILDRIRTQFQNGLFKELSPTGHDILKNWYCLAIREFCALKNFTITTENIAAALAIAPDDAEEALQLLLRLGFLRAKAGGYERSEPSLRAEDHVNPLLMAQYHLQILERAFQAVQLNRELRHLDSLVLALSSRDIETVREKIRQFIREIDMLGETSSRRDDVFQLSIQFFSLTGGRAKELKS
jgi:uncharacterized protein (TIGR02147 family)